MEILAVQDRFPVGDSKANGRLVREWMDRADQEGVDVLLLPELALTGYPPEDLLLADGFVEDQLLVLDELVASSGRVTVVCGYVDVIEGSLSGDSQPRRLVNAAVTFRDGEVISRSHKRLLPNYGVFDEERYFAPGRLAREVFEVAGTKVGVVVCEDLWRPEGADELAALGAEVLLVPNASPYHAGKPRVRAELARETTVRTGMHVVYANTVGGQDEVVFDGGSLAYAPSGDLLGRSPLFETDGLRVSINGHLPTQRQAVATWPEREEEVYSALVRSLKDYVDGNGFPGVVLGLSGGVDSALVATIAVDALGADRVLGIGMPGPYSSEGSVVDARDLAERLGVRFEVLQIRSAYEAYTSTLAGMFEGLAPNVAEENLQARARGTMLMTISNKLGHMVLSTGNKSETAVGYSTLYGDMCGGFAVISDVEKTLVYRLCEWRNANGWKGENREVIPTSTLVKPPSAELAPDQQDSDSLPPYDVLDPLLRLYVEEALSPAEILHRMEGLVTEEVVDRVVGLVDRNEYKRRQGAPGPKVTARSLGRRDRRLPITSRHRPRVATTHRSAGVTHVPQDAS